MATTVLERQPAVPVGTIKRIGPLGPEYEVGEICGQTPVGDWMIQIKLIKSGEVTEYPYRFMVEDPEAE